MVVAAVNVHNLVAEGSPGTQNLGESAGSHEQPTRLTSRPPWPVSISQCGPGLSLPRALLCWPKAMEES